MYAHSPMGMGAAGLRPVRPAHPLVPAPCPLLLPPAGMRYALDAKKNLATYGPDATPQVCRPACTQCLAVPVGSNEEAAAAGRPSLSVVQCKRCCCLWTAAHHRFCRTCVPPVPPVPQAILEGKVEAPRPMAQLTDALTKVWPRLAGRACGRQGALVPDTVR